MAAPLRPGHRDKSRDSDPLKVEKITAEFGHTYRDGDVFTLACQLNRPINIFEERLLEDGLVALTLDSTFGQTVRIETTTLDDFDLEALTSSLEELSELAVEAARASEREVQVVRTRVQALNSDLKE